MQWCPKYFNIFWPYLWHYADDKTLVTRKKIDQSLKRIGANYYLLLNNKYLNEKDQIFCIINIIDKAAIFLFIFSLNKFFFNYWNAPKNIYHFCFINVFWFLVLCKITFIIKTVPPYAISLWAKLSWVDSVWLCKTFIISPQTFTATFYFHIIHVSVRLLAIFAWFCWEDL